MVVSKSTTQSILIGLAIMLLFISAVFSFQRGIERVRARELLLDQLRQESIARGRVINAEHESRVVEAREDTTRYSASQEGWTMSTRDYVLMRAKGEGLDVKRVDLILTCESGYNPKAQNPNSTARGIFQMLLSTWNSTAIASGHSEWVNTERDNGMVQIELGLYLMKHSGYSPWSCQ